MRSMPGTRPPVARLIEESCNITDSDILMQYIREITRFYSSEQKTSSEILNQFKKDIKDIVQSYKLAMGFSFQKDINGLSESLEFLMWETSFMGIFLDDETLLRLELDKVSLKRPIEQLGEEWNKLDDFIKVYGEVKGWEKFRRQYPQGYIKPKKVLQSVYDCTCVYYEIRKAEADYPNIPNELKNLFPNESQCVDFIRRNYGKTAEFVAYAYKDEPGIIDPSDSDNSIPVIAILFRYFVEPFIKGEKEKNSARTGFYRYFKIK